MVEFPQCAVSVDEVGGGKLMEGLECQRRGRAVGGSPARLPPAQLPLIHENGQGLLPCPRSRQKALAQAELINWLLISSTLRFLHSPQQEAMEPRGPLRTSVESSLILWMMQTGGVLFISKWVRGNQSQLTLLERLFRENAFQRKMGPVRGCPMVN